MTRTITRTPYHEGVSELIEADDLLAELYSTFQAQKTAPEPKPRDPFAPPPKILAPGRHLMTAEEIEARWKRERLEALPKLRELTERIDKLRLAPVGLHAKQAAQRTAEWRTLIVDWNNEVLARDWREMSTVCEGCGSPAHLGGYEQWKRGKRVLTRFCRRKSCKRAARARYDRDNA